MKATFAPLLAALAIGGAAFAQDDPDQSFIPGPPPSGAQSPLPPVVQHGPTGGPMGGPSQTDIKLADNFNRGGCGLADNAPLSLAEPTHLSRIDLWFNWGQGERQIGYVILTPNGEQIARGVLTRAECDAYQTAWCYARGTPDLDLSAGQYLMRTARAGICQNGGSGGRGFLQAYGHTNRHAAPDGYVHETPPPPPDHHATSGQYGADIIGDRLAIDELNGAWVGTWTRRPGTDTFDAVWRNSQGQEAHDVIRLQGVNGDQVTFIRQGISGPANGVYTGTISTDGRSIRGTASWYQPGWTWTAQIHAAGR